MASPAPSSSEEKAKIVNKFFGWLIAKMAEVGNGRQMFVAFELYNSVLYTFELVVPFNSRFSSPFQPSSH